MVSTFWKKILEALSSESMNVYFVNIYWKLNIYMYICICYVGYTKSAFFNSAELSICSLYNTIKIKTQFIYMFTYISLFFYISGSLYYSSIWIFQLNQFCPINFWLLGKACFNYAVLIAFWNTSFILHVLMHVYANAVGCAV